MLVGKQLLTGHHVPRGFQTFRLNLTVLVSVTTAVMNNHGQSNLGRKELAEVLAASWGLHLQSESLTTQASHLCANYFCLTPPPVPRGDSERVLVTT